MLFACDFVHDVKVNYWHVIGVSPNQLYQGIMNMAPTETCSFILTGLGGPYFEECEDLYQCLLEFIYKVYFIYHNATQEYSNILPTWPVSRHPEDIVLKKLLLFKHHTYSCLK